LLVTQTALSVVLLIGAGLFVRSIQRIDALDHGMDVRNVLAINADFAGPGPTAALRAVYYDRALERARAVPGVLHASLAQYVPLRGANGAVFRINGSDRYIEPGGRAPRVNDVAEGFFAATGMRIIEGRDFTATDRTGSRPVAVSQSLARHVWAGRSPIGECVYLTASPDRCSQVVGVVADARTFRLREEPRPWFYRVLPSNDRGGPRVLLVRIAPNVRGVEQSLRRVLQELDPSVLYVDIRTLGDALDPQIRPWRLGVSVFTVFGVLAAVLAAVGLYAAVAYAVTQRTREIGIRIAVGATARRVVMTVLGDGSRTAAIGVLLGVGIGVALAPLLGDLLFDTSSRDPLVLAVVGVGAMIIAILASLAPARRAAAVDPMTALRME
jgi:predicted permease